MSVKIDEAKLHDGTLIRHKVTGYEGRIDGTTEIKGCFTSAGEILIRPNPKQAFQYRVVISGESMRRIAPAEDLEILEGVTLVTCPACSYSFLNKPGCSDKPGGRCQCGEWICPSCSICQVTNPCPKQAKRLARKVLLKKKARGG